MNVDVVTTQVLAREPLRDSDDWQAGYRAAIAQTIDVLRDGDHLIPEPLTREDTAALTLTELQARGQRCKDLQFTAAAGAAMLAAEAIRRTVRERYPTGAAIERNPSARGGSTEFYVVDDAGTFLGGAWAELIVPVDEYARDREVLDTIWPDEDSRFPLTCPAAGRTPSVAGRVTCHRRPRAAGGPSSAWSPTCRP